MNFTDDDIRRIRDAADGRIQDVIADYVTLTAERNGRDMKGICPKCGSKHFTVNIPKQLFKCWTCQEVAGGDAVSFLMKTQGKSFIETMDILARKFSVILDSKPVARVLPVPAKKSEKTFCQRMLRDSGLTRDDVLAKVYNTEENKSVFSLPTFRPGTLDEHGNIIDGDDVVIEYYDLDGLPVTYAEKDAKGKLTGKRKPYFRIRWQHPDDHLNKDGEPFKYKSPVGSGTPLYIPEKMRAMFKDHKTFDRLFIQEGEKKAEKSCKHDIPSVAVSGIQNLGYNGSLPEDLIRIIQRCEVKEVIFLMDSDWDDLSKNLRINVPVDKRPRCFFYAARNYKEYMRSLKNRDIYVEIYVGHVNHIGSDKGIDDLLTNSLKGHEHDFIIDFNHLINEKNLSGQYSQIFKITSWSDHKLEEIWCLDAPQKFAERHHEQLKNLPEFLIGRYRWKYDDSGNLVSAQPFDEDEKFWEEVERADRSGNVRIEYNFCYVNSQNFLQNRGFGRLRRLDGSWCFIHMENPIVRTVEASDARDYLFTFAKHHCKKEVNEMLIKGVTQYVGPDKLSLINFIEPSFLRPARDSQYFYFDDKCWLVTKDSVKETGYESIHHQIWEEQKKSFPAKYIGHPIISFTQDSDGNYNYTLTEAGRACHFLQFLINASNFTWRKEQHKCNPDDIAITEKEIAENKLHLLSKLCAMGYLLMECKDPNVTRAVIAMDGKQSEVGESNGRSGKSLIGELLRNTTTIAYINGKKKDLLDDQFIWNDVNEKTKVVFIDDVLINFNFEYLFPNITGDWTVNYKGGRRVTFPYSSSPKLYIPTNHAIKGSGSSFSDRQWLIAFSDYYNSEHKPADDFGCLFFSEWDFNQWNLTWNLIATCIQLYLTYGVVQAPGERLELRKLRQEVTEGFILWADEYFSDDSKRNIQISRRELQDAYFINDPAQRKYVTPTEFKKRFKKYCELKGYVFNPQMYDPSTGQPYKFDRDGKPITDIKSGGIEYFCIGDAAFNVHSVNTSSLPFDTVEGKLEF